MPIYEFGDFRYDTEKRVLWRESEIVPLPPKASEVLLCLLAEHGDLVDRQVLIDTVWSDTFVEEGSLNHAISALRKAIGNEFIQTVPRRGYRFAAEVTTAGVTDTDLVIERRTSSTSVIEEKEILIDDPVTGVSDQQRSSPSPRRLAVVGTSALGLILVLASAWFLLAPAAEDPQPASIRSLAVLPLQSFSPRASDEELRMRITDALITKLGRLNDLAVRPTSSVLKFAGSEHGVLDAGRALGVDAVLEGRVQEENGTLRITLQLISVVSGNQLWAGQFDGREGEILPLQDAISQKLVSALERRGNDDDSTRITTSNEAYEAYLKGRYFWNQRTPSAYLKAIEYFEEATRLDPNFALAFSGMADTYVLINRRVDGDPSNTMIRSEAAARRALELDDSLAEAHTSMGGVLAAYRRDWERSNYHFQRAIEIDPRYAIARAWYGLNLISLGRFSEASDQLEEARRLDPTSRNIAVYAIVNAYYSRRFDEAIQRGNAAIELDPALSTAYMYLGYAYEQKGQYEQAVEAELSRMRSVAPDAVDELRESFLRDGIRGFWRKQIEVKRRLSEEGVNCQQEIATRYALLGETREAIRVMEDNIRFGGTCWNGLAHEPAFDGMRSEPRFQAIIKELGFENAS